MRSFLTASRLALFVAVTFLGGPAVWAKDDVRPVHQRFTKPAEVREWQQFCRKTGDFNLRMGLDTLNNHIISMGKEGWELVCFKRPAS
ncbi:hypothetical protein MFUL124B02_11140 [Myxococcus fulvus 124B02]|nr:hypothetical protein MFUL124B02_11140 [Myxococcus fulvus 124B02]